MHRGFRYKLEPSPAQAETLGQWVGAVRFVYNLCLEQRRDFWRQFHANTGRRLNWAAQSLEVTDLRAEVDWLAAVPRACLEQALRDLEKAFAAFFEGRASYPTPRRLGSNDTARLQAVNVKVKSLNAKWSAVWLPRIGWVRFRDTRPHRGDLLSVTVSRDSAGWHVTFACDIGEPKAANDLPSVGIDRGVANTITLSTGEHLRLPDMSALERRRRKAQRVLARRKRGSRRYARQRRKVAALNARMGRIRRDWCHRTSTDISRRFGAVAMEALRIPNMTAKGRGKRGLNRSILHQAWGQLATMLAYKLEATGGGLALVDPAYTSQTCAECGAIDRESRQSQAAFVCVHCGHSAHADVNAAINIQRGSTSLLRGEGGQLGRSVEPRTLAA